jgi:hypothetical protein
MLKYPKVGWALLGLHCVWIITKLIGASVEGLRLSQVFNGIVFTIWSLFYFISIAVKGPIKFKPGSIANSILTGIVIIFWLQNVFYTQTLGAGNFSKLRIGGPYKVGVRYFHFRSKDLEAMVFYPIDDEEYRRKIDTRNARWMYRPD